MNIKENVKKIEFFDLPTAVDMLKQNSEKKQRKFVESVDIAFNLNIDAKQSNQNIRSSVVLPAGSGKNVRVIVFTDNEDLQQKALKAGAVKAGLSELSKEIEGGYLDFDYCIATPSAMKSLGKVAKILGPRGLMPNPKNGNITDDVEAVVKQAIKGKMNFKNDKYGIVHVLVGKINFSAEDLMANIKAIVNAVKEAKPEVIKGKYIKSVYLSTTMGPSVALNIDSVDKN